MLFLYITSSKNSLKSKVQSLKSGLVLAHGDTKSKAQNLLNLLTEFSLSLVKPA